MAWKPVGVDENGNLPTRVKDRIVTILSSIFAKVSETRTGAQTMPAFWRKDEGDTGQNTVYLEDGPDHKQHQISLRHFGSGTTQNYALDISNRPGASRAMCIHQYSDLTEALRLDNTDSAPTIRIVNTENQTLNPGGVGSGDPIIFEDWGVVRWKVMGDGAMAMEPKDTNHGIYIKGPTTGTKSPLYIDHRSPSNGLQVQAAASAAGFYPVLVGGQNYGPAFSTATDGGSTLLLTKNGTGSGTVLTMTNKGTGNSILVKNATENLFQITAAGDVEFLKAGIGPIIRSADNSRFRLVVGNDASITAVKL